MPQLERKVAAGVQVWRKCTRKLPTTRLTGSPDCSGSKCGQTGRELKEAEGVCRVGEKCQQLKVLCPGVPKPCYQHAAGPAQHPSVQLRTREGEKKAPTMSVLPLGILPLGGHRGCLPSLPGHSTLREPKTRKVLTNPAARRWKRMAETDKPPHPGTVQHRTTSALLPDLSPLQTTQN